MEAMEAIRCSEKAAFGCLALAASEKATKAMTIEMHMDAL